MKRFWQGSLAAFGMTLVAVLAAAAADNAFISQATIKNVDAAKRQIVTTDTEGKEWTYTLAEDAKIFQGKGEGKLSDLRAGTRCWIGSEKRGTNYVAMAVLVPEGKYKDAGLACGTVKSVNENQVTVTDDKGKDTMYQVPASAHIEIDGRRAKLNELDKGAKVGFVYEKKNDAYSIMDLCSKGTKEERKDK